MPAYSCPANWAFAKADSGDSGARRVLEPSNRYAKPMEPPLNLEAVYLGEFKRALAWASCRRPTREFWQRLPKSNSGNRGKTA